jgi:nucleoside-diphosphate-sugar epimerase
VKNPEIVIFGYGPVGRATGELLARRAQAFRVVQRSSPSDLPVGGSFAPADIENLDQVRAAIKGAKQIVLSIGLPYFGKVWRKLWPLAMHNIIEAAAEIGARLVFVDNLYMYGPQTVPLIETMPLTDFGVKPAVRAEVTRIWRAASDAGRIRVAALRAPDFYGPGCTNSHLGEFAFGALAKGKTAQFVVSPDQPHDVAYVPDFARAVVTLLDAPDDAFGQAWHVPCAPTRTLRDIFALGAAALAVKPKAMVLPRWSLAPLGLFMPVIGEMREMQFQWDRPYRVDASKFAKRFWSDATSFETGAPATALSFARSAA